MNEASSKGLILSIFRAMPRRRLIQGLALITAITMASLSQGMMVLSVGPLLQAVGQAGNGRPVETGVVFGGQNAISALNGNTSLTLTALSFIVLALLSNSLRLLAAWGNGLLTALISRDLNEIAFRNILYQPYLRQLEKSSSEVIAEMRQIDGFTTGVIAPSLQLFASATSITATLTASLIVSWQASLLAIIACTGIYIAVALGIKRPLRESGYELVNRGKLELKIQQESLGGIRDILLDQSQEVHIKRYSQSIRRSKLLGARVGFLQTTPRFIIEGAAYVALGVLCLAMISAKGTSYLSIPILGTLGLAFQNMLPSAQQAFSCWSSFRASQASASVVSAMVQETTSHRPIQETSPSSVSKEFQNWSRDITLRDAYFRYPGHSRADQEYCLSGINITFGKGQVYGVAGKTGSGKSTLVDIIMGLLPLTHGYMEVDNLILETEAQRLAWMSQIAHVPQSIFLSDSSIAENIAFGVDCDQIDYERLKWAASMACAQEFIDLLSDGFRSLVGERGNRLSGGQRQRLGIARALYKQSSLLVLDESTSALDSKTETDVMANISSLGMTHTVIMIAHRLSTLQQCDKVLVVKNGRVDCIFDSGTDPGIELGLN